MRRIAIIALLSLLPLAAGCATPGRNTATGALLGAAIGGGAGAIAGHQSGHGYGGAAIGAGLGGLAGALVGNAMDGQEEAIADAEARAETALYETESARQLSILDVIRMSQAGVSDKLIIAKMEQSQSYFDLSASDIIDLRRSGVREPVIERMIRRPSYYEAAGYPEPPRRTVERRVAYPRVLPIHLSAGYVHYR